jgi:hypothetical protein
VLGYARQYARADFIAIMECKNLVWPAGSLQDAMRSSLASNGPTQTQKARQERAALWLLTSGSCRSENVGNLPRPAPVFFLFILDLQHVSSLGLGRDFTEDFSAAQCLVTP